MPPGGRGKRAKSKTNAAANFDEKPTAPKRARLARSENGGWGRGESIREKAVVEAAIECPPDVDPACATLDRLPGCVFYHHLVPLLDLQSRISLRCLSHDMCKTVADNLPRLGPSTLSLHGSYLDKDKKPGYPYVYMRYEVCFSGIRGEVIVSIDEQRFERKYPKLIEKWLARIVDRYGHLIVEFHFKGQGDFDHRTHRHMRLSHFSINRGLLKMLSRLPNLRRVSSINGNITNDCRSITLRQKLDVIMEHKDLLSNGLTLPFYCSRMRHLVLIPGWINGLHSVVSTLQGRRFMARAPRVDQVTTTIALDMISYNSEEIDKVVALCPVVNLRVSCSRARNVDRAIAAFAHVQFNVLLFSEVVVDTDAHAADMKQLVQGLKCRRVLLSEEEEYVHNELSVAERRMFERGQAAAGVRAAVDKMRAKRRQRFQRLASETGARVVDPDSEWWREE